MSDPATDIQQAFLLTRTWRDGTRGGELVAWCWTADGPLQLRVTDVEPVCFVARGTALPETVTPGLARRRAVALLNPVGEPVDALYFSSQRALTGARDACRAAGVRLYESDLRPADRYFMERFIRAGLTWSGSRTTHRSAPAQPQRGGHGGALENGPETGGGLWHACVNPRLRGADDVVPRLSALSLDIETDGFDGALFSVALSMPDAECVLLRGAGEAPRSDLPIHMFSDERTLLEGLLDWLDVLDPDLIIGWNLIGFDLSALEKRFAANALPFAIGRARERARVLPSRAGQPPMALIPGRVALDGIESLRAAFWTFEDYTLEAVAQTLLGRGKLLHGAADKGEAIRALYETDPVALARYNLEDARLVAEVFQHTDLINMAIERARLTGLALGRHGGSVASLDNLYLPRLHRRGRVARDVGDTSTGTAGSPGGHVLDSRPGLYDNVIVLDFKSLYPSIIRTFQIDPLGLWAPGDDPVAGFLGAEFAREGAILPALIDELWAARDAAKASRNGPLSQAVKIIMNAFYGVLGSTGCRFFDPRLASSITRRGHEVLKRSRDYLEARDLDVIYGDTDSLFVLLEPSLTPAEARAAGAALAVELNDWWRERIAAEHRLRSRLEVEFEIHFSRFLMPTLRGSELGSKKRYAGLVIRDTDEELVFKGLESVRTDWTPLARRFQRELYRRVFHDEPYVDYVTHTMAALNNGELDAELVYRKRLRRGIDEYRTNVPPQVQAARAAGQRSGWVRYVITRQGPQPADAVDAALDYEHYAQRQLAPVADGILHFLGTSFAQLTDRQLEIF